MKIIIWEQAFIILLSTVGVLKGSMVFWIFFTTFHILSCFLLSVNIYYMGRWKLNRGIFRRIWLICVNDCRQKKKVSAYISLHLEVNIAKLRSNVELAFIVDGFSHCRALFGGHWRALKPLYIDRMVLLLVRKIISKHESQILYLFFVNRTDYECC